MKKYIKSILINLLFLSFIFTSCNINQEEKKDITNDPEKMMVLNKAMIASEQEDIDEYISRYQYKMEATKTGLNYLHLKEGSGKQPVMNNDVTLKYTISLLDGSYCYSSDSSGLLTFRMGQSSEPGGLQEGLLLMKEGGSALFIIPSWLAYGITGDGNKIGSNQSLVYNVSLIKVK